MNAAPLSPQQAAGVAAGAPPLPNIPDGQLSHLVQRVAFLTGWSWGHVWRQAVCGAWYRGTGEQAWSWFWARREIRGDTPSSWGEVSRSGPDSGALGVAASGCGQGHGRAAAQSQVDHRGSCPECPHVERGPVDFQGEQWELAAPRITSLSKASRRFPVPPLVLPSTL